MRTAGEDATSFQFKKALFGAIDGETQKLLLVVEAENDEEAGRRIDSVLPFFGVVDVCSITCVGVMGCPLGIPSFLDAFFEGTGLGAVRNCVAPSTETLQ